MNSSPFYGLYHFRIRKLRTPYTPDLTHAILQVRELTIGAILDQAGDSVVARHFIECVAVATH